MTGTNRIEVLDGWRGLAILLVLVGHFTFSGWIWEERMGVDVFFVLSGLLISKILFIDRISLKDFYVRRLSRVMPTLIVFLCAAAFISVLLKYDFKIIEFFASLFFIRTYFPSVPEYFTSPLPTGHLWSLSVEEHSYVLMSIMAVFLITRRKVTFMLLAIYVASVAVNLMNFNQLPNEAFTYSLIRTESAIGFIAFSGGYSLLKTELDIKLPAYTAPLFLLLAAICYIDALPIWLTFIFGPVFLGVAVNHLVDSSRQFSSLLMFFPLRQLGIMSYSIYLWQQIFYKLYYTLPGGPVTGFVLSIMVGAGSYYVIENPLRHYINRRWSPNPVYRRNIDLTTVSN